MDNIGAGGQTVCPLYIGRLFTLRSVHHQGSTVSLSTVVYLVYRDVAISIKCPYVCLVTVVTWNDGVGHQESHVDSFLVHLEQFTAQSIISHLVDGKLCVQMCSYNSYLITFRKNCIYYIVGAYFSVYIYTQWEMFVDSLRVFVGKCLLGFTVYFQTLSPARPETIQRTNNLHSVIS